MSIVSIPSRHAVPAAPAHPGRSDFGVPPWVTEVLARSGAEAAPADAPDLCVLGSATFTLVTARTAGATAMDPGAFESATRLAYTSIARCLRASRAPHPVRFWNYIPDIHRPCGETLDRYMAFNAGRFAACSDWFGGPNRFERMLATGSGVGHGGQDLVIHALATADPGIAVENPRQIPAYRYSRRFGPRPPCFARATVIRPAGVAPLLLVGGTASIRGEESVHVGDLRAQTLETFENLASLLRSASAHGEEAGTSLDAFRELRVYYVREADRASIAQLVEPAFKHVGRIEYLNADLCRRELAVEIEGVAELESQSGDPESES